jgi:hypothetical protein
VVLDICSVRSKACAYAVVALFDFCHTVRDFRSHPAEVQFDNNHGEAYEGAALKNKHKIA